MKSRTGRVIVVALAMMLVGIPSVDAAKKPSNKNKPKTPQNKSQAENQAKATLQDAQRQTAAAAAQIGAAKKQVDHARDKAIDTRHNVVKEHDRAPSLQAARRLWDEARATLAEASTPVLDQLELDPKYKEAVLERDTLREKTLKLAKNSPEQSRLQSEWSQASGRVQQMEKAALLADPRTKAAMEALEQEETDVRALIDRKEQEIKSDPSLNSATQEIQQAKSALSAAQAQYASELRQLAQAQQNLAKRSMQAKNNGNKNNKGKSNKRRR